MGALREVLTAMQRIAKLFCQSVFLRILKVDALDDYLSSACGIASDPTDFVHTDAAIRCTIHTSISTYTYT
jgi:hypothetical protein